MQLIKSAAAMQRTAESWRCKGLRIGFVPTMGCLHAGHLSLVARARRNAGPRGKVVVSIYVNPTQFGPGEDFLRYPRDIRRDLQRCRQAGVDAVFAPPDSQMYPGGTEDPHSTSVVEEELSRRLEGAARPGHFRGVATVVAKLFNLVRPHAAVFGAKDYQQAAVIRRMTRDLQFPVKIVVAPTVREPDGLAMSSRNRYLTGNLRGQAGVLCACIQLARALVRRGPVSAANLERQIRKLVQCEPDARLDYVEFFHPGTLAAIPRVRRGAQMALAVFIGNTRLIDNARL